MLEGSIPHGSRSDYQGTIRHGLGYGRELAGAGEHGRGSHCRARLTKSDSIGIDQRKMPDSEVAHRTRRRPNVEWVARAHQYDDQTLQV
jgi:hypothetical protein